MSATFNMIVAVCKNAGFGNKGKIPWHYKEDMKWFSKKTKGYTCLMGKNTYLDLVKMTKSEKNPDKDPLPDRKILVLTSSDDIPLYGSTERVNSIEEVLYDYHDQRLFVCGGERLYKDCLSYTDTIFMTVIDSNFDCDVFFPVERLEKTFKIYKCEKKLCKNIKSRAKPSHDLYFTTYIRG